MCYHVSQHKDVKDIRKKIPAKFREDNADKFKPVYHVSGFAKPWLPVLVSDRGVKTLDFFRWGLIPGWVKEEKDWKANTLNARNDEFFEKASYKNYWRNRCLIVCTGFFEPHTPEKGVASKSQKTESWYIKSTADEFFTLGAVYSFWKGMPTFSIITTTASPLMAEIHNEAKRMPLILDNEDVRDSWLLGDLKQEEMGDLMGYRPEDKYLDAFRTIDGVMNNRVDTNVPEVLTPL